MSWRRSWVNCGMGTVIVTPSLDGLKPISDVVKLFSISRSEPASQG